MPSGFSVACGFGLPLLLFLPFSAVHIMNFHVFSHAFFMLLLPLSSAYSGFVVLLSQCRNFLHPISAPPRVSVVDYGFLVVAQIPSAAANRPPLLNLDE